MPASNLGTGMEGSIHSPVAGDIAVSLARSTSRVSASAWPDKTHVQLLDDLEEEPEEQETTSLFSARNAKRVFTIPCCTSSAATTWLALQNLGPDLT